jgi:DNA mismatch repair ATPase MutS
MEMPFLSLLYPSEAEKRRHEERTSVPNITPEVCSELGFDEMLTLKNSALCEYFTLSEDVIRYRQKTLADMERLPALAEALAEALPILCDIAELRRLDASSTASGESYLYSITEIELYISCVEALKTSLLPLKDQFESPAFLKLASVIEELTESEYYRDLNEDLRRLSSRIHEVKSVTVGVNLDAELRPKDAGVISINAETFKSGKVLDKILRMSFRNDAFTCIADIVPFDKGQSENRKEAMQTAFHSAIDQVFRSSVRAWRAIVGEYVLDNTDFLLRILPEIEFVTRAADLTRKLRERGYAVCVPEIRPIAEKAFAAKALYNPSVAMQIADEVVPNDFAFDQNGELYVLTGPNRGGKSVITCAVGLAQAMAQLGMCVPAESAAISPVDAIFTHFPTGADDTIDKGRLGEECARLREILDEVTDKSLILLDESLSSTGAYEASFIASELLCGFSHIGARGIFSTHLHELAASVDEINERTAPLGGIRLDNLVAGMEEGRRSFLILRKKPDGKSYASDIAAKYGLSFDSIQKAHHAKASD